MGSSSYTTAAGSNRLLGVSQPAMSWSYDARGNAQTTGPQAADWQATHDPVGQLSRLSRGPAVTFYQYDAERRRVLKDSSANPGGGWTVYVYGLRGELLGEYDHSTGGAMREYAWLQDTPVALIGRTSLNASDEAYFIHTDHLDTPRLLTDRLGRVRWSWLAEPFGNEAANHQPTAGLDAINLPLRMPGQIWDPESGLFYNHHRYCEARVGRYVQSDPIGLQGGINTYAYAEGNPVSYTDPTGEFVPQLIGFGIGAGLEYLTNPCASATDILVAGGLGALGGAASKAVFLRYGPKSRTSITGKEWSHSISRSAVNRHTSGPLNSALNQRGGLNGSWTSPTRHYMHDSSRYPSGWREMGRRLPEPLQVLDRIPDWLKGTIASGAAGAGVAGSDCECRR